MTFKGIKVGDTVIVHTWSGSFHIKHKYTLCKVIKVNKKTFKLDKYTNYTFTIDYGSVYGGDGWERINLMNYDAEFYEKKIAEQKAEELRISLLNKIKYQQYEKLTNDQLERIVNIIEENIPKEENA